MKIKLLLVVLLANLQWLSGQTPEYIVVSPGSTVHLSATSDDADSYNWFYNGNLISGETTASYSATQQGWYSVIAFSEEGCPSLPSDEIEIRFEIVPPKAEQQQEFCLDDSSTLSDVEISGENIQWYADEAGTEPLLETEFLVEGIYYATQTIDGIESDPIEIYIQLLDCSDLLALGKFVNREVASAGDVVIFTVRVFNRVSYPIEDIVVEDQLPSGYEYQHHETTAGIYNPSTGIWEIPVMGGRAEAELRIWVEVLSEGNYVNRAEIIASTPEDNIVGNNRSEVSVQISCLEIYNIFTPNGDGKNDTFKIACIEKYPNNTLKVYNRWGQSVYEKFSYDNSWEGIANRSAGMIKRNEGLPPGTYYYVFDPGNGASVISGWLYINN